MAETGASDNYGLPDAMATITGATRHSDKLRPDGDITLTAFAGRLRPKSLPRFCRTHASIGGEGEIDSGHPGPRPSGAPAGVQNRSRDFVEPTLRLAERVRLTRAILALALRAPLRASKIAPAIVSNSRFDWRRGRD